MHTDIGIETTTQIFTLTKAHLVGLDCAEGKVFGGDRAFGLCLFCKIKYMSCHGSPIFELFILFKFKRVKIY